MNDMYIGPGLIDVQINGYLSWGYSGQNLTLDGNK